MNDPTEERAKHAQIILLLAKAAFELAIENRNYRQLCGDLVLPPHSTAPDIAQAEALLVELQQLLTDHPASPRIGEVLAQITESLRTLRS